MRTQKTFYMMILFLFELICFIDCTQFQEKIPLKEHELRLLPYKGNETLVFESSKGDYDTMKLKGIRFGYPDGPKTLEYYPQTAAIHGVFSNPNPPGNLEHEYLYGRLFEVTAGTPKVPTRIGIFLKAKNSVLYGKTIFTIDEMESFEKTKFSINGRLIDDVTIINTDTTAQIVEAFLERKDLVSTIYWSKSEGLVAWKKKDGEVWTKSN